MKKEWKPSTLAIKSTENRLHDSRPVSTPIYLSTTFERRDDGSYTNDFVYSRDSNPNRQILEESIALLEGGEVAYAFSSGMAAIHAVLQSLQHGDHLLIPDDVYYNLYTLLVDVLERWGLSYTKVDMASPQAISASIQTNTRLIWLETPSNPQLKVSDITAVAHLAQQHGCLVAVDNTWPTPILQQPLLLGADIVVHSTTKYFGGHSDVLSGAVVLKQQGELAQRIRAIQKYGGSVPSPFDCWLVCRGIQTMPLRVQAQSTSALHLANFLANHPAIASVNYPGLPEHPQHNISKQQMRKGFGGMLSVLVKGDANQAMTISNKLELFTTATSLGGVESLVEHRQSVEGTNSKTPVNLLRLSVGLEDVEDLIADWKQALEA